MTCTRTHALNRGTRLAPPTQALSWRASEFRSAKRAPRHEAAGGGAAGGGAGRESIECYETAKATGDFMKDAFLTHFNRKLSADVIISFRPSADQKKIYVRDWHNRCAACSVCSVCGVTSAM